MRLLLNIAVIFITSIFLAGCPTTGIRGNHICYFNAGHIIYSIRGELKEHDLSLNDWEIKYEFCASLKEAVEQIEREGYLKIKSFNNGEFELIENDKSLGIKIRYLVRQYLNKIHISNIFIEDDRGGPGIWMPIDEVEQKLKKLKKYLARLIIKKNKEDFIKVIELSWKKHVDLDLYIFQPDGQKVNYRDRENPKGFLDKDVQSEGGAETYYTIVPGDYRVQIHYYSGQESAEWYLKIYQGEQYKIYKGILDMEKQWSDSITFHLEGNLKG